MLGYGGRSNRREFVGGAALLTVGPMAFSMALIPDIPVLIGGQSREGGVLVGLVLTLVVVVVIIVCLWGWTVLMTRRARDIGWPAWLGVAITVGLSMLGSVSSPIVLYAWIGLMAVLGSDMARGRAKSPAETFA